MQFDRERFAAAAHNRGRTASPIRARQSNIRRKRTIRSPARRGGHVRHLCLALRFRLLLKCSGLRQKLSVILAGKRVSLRLELSLRRLIHLRRRRRTRWHRHTDFQEKFVLPGRCAGAKHSRRLARRIAKLVGSIHRLGGMSIAAQSRRLQAVVGNPRYQTVPATQRSIHPRQSSIVRTR